MDANFIIAQLRANKHTFESMLADVYEAMARWQPGAGKWSILEVVCHLHDEEREDFRARVQHTLLNKKDQPHPIDPTGWVMERMYFQQDFEKVRKDFLHEREESLQYLKGLQNPQWANAFEHPKWGPMEAGMFLSSWLAHDYLHMRQITFNKFNYHQQHCGQNLQYAGEW